MHKKDPQTKSLEGIIDPSLEIRILVSFCFYIHTLWCISLATCGRVYYKAVLEADSLCNLVSQCHHCLVSTCLLSFVFKYYVSKGFWGLTDPQLDRWKKCPISPFMLVVLPGKVHFRIWKLYLENWSRIHGLPFFSLFLVRKYLGTYTQKNVDFVTNKKITLFYLLS